jgi:hypothetical protein
MRTRALVAATATLASVAVALSGCAVGAPPGFSSGDQWTIPLIGPLEDGLLLVPALVNDKGPFVFAIDTDAHVSVIDHQVVHEARPRTGEGPKMLDETDTQQTRLYGEILRWQIGTLAVEGTRPAQVVPAGTFDAHGRRIHGLIGRDIIAESLVFSFDRDMGVITLSTQRRFSPPAGPATATLKYSKLHSQIQNAEVQPMARRLVKVTIGDVTVPVHLDLGASTSQLRPRLWAKAKLDASDVELGVVDEAGTTRVLKQIGTAPKVTVAGASAQNVVFVPYTDKRWPAQDIEGTLGLGFFKPFKVTVNWDKSAFYLEPRTNTKLSWQARMGRWQSKTLASCEHLGCVKVSVVDPVADKPVEERPEKHPGLVVSVVRDAPAMQMDLEVLIAVTPSDDSKPLHHWLVANLPAGVPRVMTHLSADHVGAEFTIVDVSTFPRKCPAEGGCIDRIAAPQK